MTSAVCGAGICQNYRTKLEEATRLHDAQTAALRRDRGSRRRLPKPAELRARHGVLQTWHERTRPWIGLATSCRPRRRGASSCSARRRPHATTLWAARCARRCGPTWPSRLPRCCRRTIRRPSAARRCCYRRRRLRSRHSSRVARGRRPPRLPPYRRSRTQQRRRRLPVGASLTQPDGCPALLCILPP